MSTTPHSPPPSNSYQTIPWGLPPVTITRQALSQFNLSMYQQLTELEKQFAHQPQPAGIFLRESWQPAPRKPR